MLIEGPLGSGKTSKLLCIFENLILSGVKTSEILFLCENSYKKQVLTDKIKAFLVDKVDGLGKIPVTTFNGLVYNTVLKNYPIIESFIKSGEPCVIPQLTGLELSQYLLKSCIKNADFSDYNSKTSLLHQLLRRNTLITNNDLSVLEVKKASFLLEHSFANDAQKALSELKSISTESRAFDYLRQTNIFLYLLKNDMISDFEGVKYLFVDDFDEIPYSCYQFVEKIMKSAKESYIAFDSEGGSRRGYLCAYTKGINKIKNLNHQNIELLKTSNPLYEDINKLFENIKNNKNFELKNIELTVNMKRAEMINVAFDKVFSLIQEGVSPEDIKIITPFCDEIFKFSAEEFFEKNNIKLQFLSGNKRLTDDVYVSGLLSLLSLSNPQWRCECKNFDLRILLCSVLGIPVYECRIVLQKYYETKVLDESFEFDNVHSDLKYKNLISSIKNINKEQDIYEQAMELFLKVILPEISADTSIDSLNLAIKTLKDFSEYYKKLNEKPLNFEKDIIVQLKNTVVADNPPGAPEIKSDSIIIATPQKIADYELCSKYQVWLDVADNEWVKEDIGPLYNAWYFEKDNELDVFTPEISASHTKTKVAHLVRKIALCANTRIFAFSSVLNLSGQENTGGIAPYLSYDENSGSKGFKQIVPREDQKPVLEYKSGKMAVPAVPGAGKTTIMQALIIKLLNDDVPPEKILVLTYMESAARNFQNRIKACCPNLKEFPYISTIHSLALRIIQDNNNFLRLNLDSDFEICDEIKYSRIINRIISKNMHVGEEVKKYDVAISQAKISGVTPQTIKKALKTKYSSFLKDFLPAYEEYERILRSKNLLDYDDLLVKAVELLREHPDVLKYYQEKFQYVIEDEAQDSSAIQQELIELICAKDGNLIRCGDVNQAIMNTFTNSDVKGFKDFIKNNKCVEMSCSQRCAKDIYGLANNLVDYSLQIEGTKDAFYDLKMQPVMDKNPEPEGALSFSIFETQQQEVDFVVNEVKNLLENDSEANIAILLRGNDQVHNWMEILENNGIKTLCLTEKIKNQKVFKIILAWLKVIAEPWDNSNVANLYKEIAVLHKKKADKNAVFFLEKSLKTPFIELDILDQEVKQDIYQLWWDIRYFLNLGALSVEKIITRIGEYYFIDAVDKSNVYIIISAINRFFAQADSEKTLTEVISYLESLANQKTNKIRFFNDTEEVDTLQAKGFVKIMTIHKSKGDEFDAVFIPEFSEHYYGINPDSGKKDVSKLLIEKIKELNPKLKAKSHEELMKEQVEETLRLIYVAITRAKKKLFFTCPQKVKNRYNKVVTCVPSTLLEMWTTAKEEKEELICNQ